MGFSFQRIGYKDYMLYPFLLFIIAQTLLYLEFFMPGGILAILSFASAVLGTYLVAQSDPIWALLYMLLQIGSAFAVCYLAIKKVKSSGGKDTFFLSNDQMGYVPCELPKEYIGTCALTSTEMKPSGYIQIAKLSYQAVSAQGYIAKGEPVEIVSAQGSHYVVIPKTKITT